MDTAYNYFMRNLARQSMHTLGKFNKGDYYDERPTGKELICGKCGKPKTIHPPLFNYSNEYFNQKMFEYSSTHQQLTYDEALSGVLNEILADKDAYTCLNVSAGVLCDCQQESRDKYEALKQRTSRMQKIQNARAGCFRGKKALSTVTFQSCKNGYLAQKAQSYCNKIDTMLQENKGLMMCGDKIDLTNIAACMANELLEREYTAQFITFDDIINKPPEEYYTFSNSLQGFDVLIINGFELTENKLRCGWTPAIVESRTYDKKITIITTQLHPQTFKQNTKQYKEFFDFINANFYIISDIENQAKN